MGNQSSSSARTLQSYPGAQQQASRITYRLAGMSSAPGAYSIAPQQPRGQSTQFVTVRVPNGTRPGEEFTINVSGTRYQVVCPPDTRPGQTVRVELRRSNRSQSAQQEFFVTVPPGVRPLQQFPVMARGHQVMVTCPEGVRPGQQVRITIPRNAASNSAAAPPPGNPGRRRATPPRKNGGEEKAPNGFTMYEVVVPPNIRPGMAFMLLANGQRVMVTCPAGAQPGSKVRFQLPNGEDGSAGATALTLHYNKDGWVRSLEISSEHFMWVHNKSKGPEEPPAANAHDIDPDAMCFVRELTGRGTRMVPAALARQSGVVPGSIVNFRDLARVAGDPFSDKSVWFRQVVRDLRVPWEEGHMAVRVRRSNLLADAQEAFNNVDPQDFRKIFRFEFIGEPGIDAGGVAREFYQLASAALFDANNGLFMSSAINQTCMQINPASGLANEAHLDFFAFAGRLLAKALFDQQLVAAHLVRPLYKQILGWPIGLHDLEHLDYDTYKGLLSTLDLEDVSVLCLDLTVDEERYGERFTVELVPNGAEIALTNERLRDFLEQQITYRTCRRVEEQLSAMLRGFYDVLPPSLLSVFDFQELELLLCGLPTIDMEDWKAHSVYEGAYEAKGAAHKVVRWFWEIVEDEFSEEQKARLLQFVTGTSGVPAQGFSALQGNDGNIRLFTVTSMPLSQGIFPRSHTCFNRIDMPVYANKKQLKKYLTLAIQLEATGFTTD